MSKAFETKLAATLARPTREARISGLQLLGLKCVPGSWYQNKVIALLKAEGYGK